MTENKKDSLKLEFTGRGSVLLDITGHGPITLEFNDVGLASKLTGFFLEHCEDDLTVLGYEDGQQEAVTGILQRPLKLFEGAPPE